jgi:hypothetical protein
VPTWAKRLLQGVPEEKAINRATVTNRNVLAWYLSFAADARERVARPS